MWNKLLCPGPARSPLTAPHGERLRACKRAREHGRAMRNFPTDPTYTARRRLLWAISGRVLVPTRSVPAARSIPPPLTPAGPRRAGEEAQLRAMPQSANRLTAPSGANARARTRPGVSPTMLSQLADAPGPAPPRPSGRKGAKSTLTPYVNRPTLRLNPRSRIVHTVQALIARAAPASPPRPPPNIIASDGPQRPYNVRRGRGERENLSYYEG